MIMNLMLLSCYGIVKGVELDFFLVSFFFFSLIELAMRIGTSGWKRFWFVHEDFFQQARNHYDFYLGVATVAVCIMAVMDKINRGKTLWFEPFKSNDINDWTRVVLALPVLRIFSTVKQVRDIVMGLLVILPMYAHVFTLILIFFYFYAALGCMLFAAEFKYLQDNIQRQANFNSFVDALSTLWISFEGSTWSTVMHAAIDVGSIVPAILYFSSFVIIVSMLIANLVFGVIISGYGAIDEFRSTEHVATADVLNTLKEGKPTKSYLQLRQKASGAMEILPLRENSHRSR